jgi:hypothetical protein
MQLKSGITIEYKKIVSNVTLTHTKQHYTEAKLVQLLEERGIGRPSTFSSLVEKIQEREYVKKDDVKGKELVCKNFELDDDVLTETNTKKEFGNEKGKLVIQPLGKIVMEFIEKNCGEFINYEYTSNMEKELDDISNGLTDTTVTVFNDKLSQSFEFSVKTKATGIVFDPNNLILKDVETTLILANEPTDYANFGLTVAPNPSSEDINISFRLAKSSIVRISIIDFSGKEILSQPEEKLPIGNYSRNFKISEFQSGNFILNLNIDGQNESRKLITFK